MRRGFLLALAAALLGPIPPLLGQALAQEQTRIGTFVELWTDPPPGSPLLPSVDYVLLDDDGGWLPLSVSAEVLRTVGGPRALLRTRVSVSGFVEAGAAAEEPGIVLAGARFHVTSVAPLAPEASIGTGAFRALPPVQRYVTLLCRFPSSTDDHPRDLGTYRFWLGDAQPGMGHYWDALSGGRLDFRGETVMGWYVLPGTLADYFQDPLPGERRRPDWGALARDCAGAADGQVDYSHVDGVNLQFNVDFGAAWGGSSVMALDGPARLYGVTWMPAWSSLATYGHEIGHTFGLPPSSGPYQETYDSRWDVMSNGSVHWEPSLGTWIGQHTIAFHRDLLGWVAPDRRWTAGELGTLEEIPLAFWDAPEASGWALATLPLSDGTFYTVEARRTLGYDERIPFPGVLLHRVDPWRNDRLAQVVDVDGNGDPNDPSAVWTPGEVFEDGANGVTVRVVDAFGGEGEPGEGYRVEVSRGWWLDVVVSGTGRVRSPGGEIDCAESCSRLLSAPGSLVLSADGESGEVFAGWGGDCSGAEVCTVALGSRATVEAVFTPPLTITSPTARPPGVVGACYEDALSAAGGTGVYRWRLTEGSLPRGMALDSVRGTLSGIPEEPGDFAFEIAALSRSLEARGSFRLAVETPDLQRQQVIDELLAPGSALTWDERRYLDIVGNGNGRFDLGDVQRFLKGGGR